MDRFNLPLCVDLDGTLIRSDITWEAIVKALKESPWIIALLPIWVVRGRHYLKMQLASLVDLDVKRLPYNQNVIELVKTARSCGRATLLVTGSVQKYAEQIGRHIGLFDEVIATDAGVNLTGRRKAQTLSSRFGADGYKYVANAWVDLPVWRTAGEVVSVGASERLIIRLNQLGKPHQIIRTSPASARIWVRALRFHQWSKNALLFVPILTAHKLLDLAALQSVLTAFIAFGLIASMGYIVNDLLDLESDRRHPTKRSRPFASGDLSIASGLIVGAVLLASGLSVATLLPSPFLYALLIYLASTVLYSLWLKRVASLDVLVLAALYAIRVIAGAFAAGLSLSFWLLAFALFMFLCLAWVKRVAELIELADSGDLSQVNPAGEAHGREYRMADISIIQSLGTSSGYMAILVMALYINSPDVALLYATPELLWLMVPLLMLWVTRLWVVTSRGYMHEDPIVFAIKDPETWLTALAAALILASATFIAI